MEMEFRGYAIRPNLTFHGNDYISAATDSSAIVVSTEWDEYASMDYS